MQRVLEPELMEQEDQARAYAEADFAEPHQAVIDLLCARLKSLPATGRALDLGCGPADVTIRFARARPGWTTHGLDGSAAMLAHGQRAVSAAGLDGRVTLQLGRLPDAAPPQPPYDLVFSNSLLHHLPDPAVLWQAVARWTREQGAVFIMDLRRPDSVAQASALVQEYAASEPEVLKRDFFNSLCAAFTPDELRAQLAAAGIDGLQVEVVSDRHLIAWGQPRTASSPVAPR